MMKKIVATSLVAVALILSGCSGDEEGENQLAIQQMLDTGDYNGVISSLGDGNNSSEYMLLGAAYMGRSGVGFTDLIDIVIESTDSNAESTFGAFANSLSKKTEGNPNALVDLQHSTDFYEKVMDKNCSSGVDLSVSEKDVCLFSGLAQTVKAATTLSYMADDLSFLEGTGDGTDSKLQASACAMEYAFNGTQNTCTFGSIGKIVMFDNNVTYESVQIIVNAESFEYIIKGALGTLARSPSMTNGFCTLDYSDFVLDKNVSTYNPLTFHVCPVDRVGDANLSMTAVLVDALNDGTDSIGAAGTDDTRESINEFKCEVLGGTFSNTSCDKSGDVTEKNVIDYLNDNNK